MKEARKRIVSNINIDEKTGCWNWSGNPRENGYCRTTYKRVNWYIHRLSFASFIGEIPENKDVCHKCDNRRCCNPNHLFIGSRKENMQDALLKGRVARGFRLPQTKLSQKDKQDILKRALAGEKYSKIAEKYNVSKSTIGNFARKKGVIRNVKQKF